MVLPRQDLLLASFAPPPSDDLAVTAIHSGVDLVKACPRPSPRPAARARAIYSGLLGNYNNTWCCTSRAFAAGVKQTQKKISLDTDNDCKQLIPKCCTSLVTRMLRRPDWQLQATTPETYAVLPRRHVSNIQETYSYDICHSSWELLEWIEFDGRHEPLDSFASVLSECSKALLNSQTSMFSCGLHVQCW